MPLEDYQIENFLGMGSFGKVYKGKNTSTGKVYAVKLVDLELTNDVKKFIKEIQFLSRIHSPHLNNYREAFMKDSTMWIVLEYCGGGSCADLLKIHGKFLEQTASYIMKGTLYGLQYLHEHQKVHRDIKLANILLTDDGKIKLADFGVSGELSYGMEKRNTLVGTPYWMAPEVIVNNVKGYDTRADIWSTGITVIEFVTGRPPLSSIRPMEALFQIPKNKPPELEGDNFSPEIKSFVKHCLAKSPKSRATALQLLSHHFITGCPKDTSILHLIQEGRRRAEKKKQKKRKQHKDEPVEGDATINWVFPESIEIPRPEIQTQPSISVHADLITQAFNRLILRARTETAKESVAELRSSFREAEEINFGLSYAFVEELRFLIDKRGSGN